MMTGKNITIGGGGFHHLSLRVRDFDASLEFYTKGLGFENRTSWASAPNKRTALLDTGDGNYLEVSESSEKAAPGGPVAHFALRTADCDLAIERARRAGAEITVEPKDVVLKADPPFEVRLGFCKGPDGEVIEFFQNDAT